MSSEDPAIVKPMPRRPFSLTPLTSAASAPESPTQEHDEQNAAPPSRTRSILNLTSSTLFGIYNPSDYSSDRDGTTTPWGNGAETPIDHTRTPVLPQETNLNIDESQWAEKTRKRRHSVLDQSAQKAQRHDRRAMVKKRKGFRNYWVPLVYKSSALAAVGICYGVLISHLHDRQQLAPVPVEGIPHQSWSYIAFWGMAGVALGRLMPWVDHLWDNTDEDDNDTVGASRYGSENARRRSSGSGRQARSWWTPEWTDVVRSIGAFIGIAFAIRKLPWQSTLQLSLTLALSNPAIWYLLDRTPPGFILSTTVAITGTALALGINPNLIPSPMEAARSRPPGRAGNATLFKMQLPNEGEHLIGGMISQESVGVATWIASVLFVSCVCFGNIGRRLK